MSVHICMFDIGILMDILPSGMLGLKQKCMKMVKACN